MISDDEAKFYHDNGYLVVEDVYTAEEINEMNSVLDTLVEESREITENDGIYDLEPTHSPENPRVRRIKNPYLVHPIYRKMVEHPNIIAICNKLVGPDQRLHGGKINIKGAEYGSPVEWHQDWAFYPHTNDDVLAVGVMLDDMTEENGPMLMIPGSHKGPTFDHNANGQFAGAMDPDLCPLDYSGAAKVIGKAGSCSFHHVRIVHGSEQNRSDKDRRLLLYHVAAADAWDLRRFNESWEEHESRMIAGASTLQPRIVDIPVRLPYPPAKFDGSIYEQQRSVRSRYFDFDKELQVEHEDAD